MSERKIGEVFLCGIKILKCIAAPHHTCEGCVFDSGINCNNTNSDFCFTGSCFSLDRKDNTNVIFIEN